jgi:hypothetical protein
MIVAIVSCSGGDDKSAQTINFAEIAPQNFMDSSLLLRATSSSGLPVTFVSSDTRIAVVEGNVVKFVAVGRALITAKQSGNESFHEAPNITRELTIRDWDPSKKTQTISFDELPLEWSNDSPPLPLVAVSTSGLPVAFTSSDTKATIDGNLLLLFHGTYKYDIYIDITASQGGNAEYNPAENVVRTIRAIGEGTH